MGLVALEREAGEEWAKNSSEVLLFDVSVNKRGNGDKLYNQLFHDYDFM